MVVWIIGLAGAGKTSTGRALFNLMKSLNPATVFIDGDEVRTIMDNDLGHSLEDRRRNGWRICRLCNYLDRQGIDVVCATLSQFHEQQRWNRETFSRYFEIYLDVPLSVLAERDQKGLYSGALAGNIKNVVGVDMAFPKPISPDLVIENNTQRSDFTPIAQQIFQAMRDRFPDWAR